MGVISSEWIDENSLTFCYEYRLIYPILSWLALLIYFILATTASVQSQPNASGMMFKVWDILD